MRGLKAATLTLILGFCALWMTMGSAKAQIDPLFQAGDAWHGIVWDAGNTTMQDMRLAIWSVNGNSFQGGLQLFGRGRVVAGRFSADGSVDIAEMYSTVPITLHGRTAITGDGSVSVFFTMAQAGRSLGSGRGLRLFSAVEHGSGGGGGAGVPPDPYLPPGPCYIGQYQSAATGFLGKLSLTFDPTAKNTGADRPQPSDLTGTLLLGDRSFNFISSLDGRMLDNGHFKFDLIAHAVNSITPCIKVTGELLPAVRPGESMRFIGTYELINANQQVIDRGAFDIAAP